MGDTYCFWPTENAMQLDSYDLCYLQRLKEARLPSMRLHVIFLMKCSHQAALLEIHAGSTSKTSEFL